MLKKILRMSSQLNRKGRDWLEGVELRKGLQSSFVESMMIMGHPSGMLNWQYP